MLVILAVGQVFCAQAAAGVRRNPSPPSPRRKLRPQVSPAPSGAASTSTAPRQQFKLQAVPRPFRKSASEEHYIVVQDDLYRVEISNRGAVVKSWQLSKYKDDNKPQRVLDVVHPDASQQTGGWPFALVLDNPDLEKAANNGLYKLSSDAAAHHHRAGRRDIFLERRPPRNHQALSLRSLLRRARGRHRQARRQAHRCGTRLARRIRRPHRHQSRARGNRHHLLQRRRQNSAISLTKNSKASTSGPPASGKVAKISPASKTATSPPHFLPAERRRSRHAANTLLERFPPRYCQRRRITGAGSASSHRHRPASARAPRVRRPQRLRRSQAHESAAPRPRKFWLDGIHRRPALPRAQMAAQLRSQLGLGHRGSHPGHQYGAVPAAHLQLQNHH